MPLTHACGRRHDEVCGAVREALRNGVPLLAGTDAVHGGLAYELATLQDFGGAPPILLRAATGNAAQALGLAGEIGTVRDGAAADLVAVRCLADVLLVVPAGRIVEKGLKASTAYADSRRFPAGGHLSRDRCTLRNPRIHVGRS